jgi:hypothetical protein
MSKSPVPRIERMRYDLESWIRSRNGRVPRSTPLPRSSSRMTTLSGAKTDRIQIRKLVT